MTYKTLEDIEKAFEEPANETEADKKRRLKSKRQAISRFNARQAQPSQIQTRSQTAAAASGSTTSQIQTHARTTASATARKQKSRAVLTDEQRLSIQEENTTKHRIKYAVLYLPPILMGLGESQIPLVSYPIPYTHIPIPIP